MSSGYEMWGQKWADFALVVDTGEELKCHKVLLAQSSPFFDAMLSSNLEETKSNKMNAKDFSLDTVATFLEYLYADAFNKNFDKAKITPELMRLCHMYDVQGLYDLATGYLKDNICDTNAVGIWLEAEKIKNEDMKTIAIEYIANKKEDIAKLAGMDEGYKCPELVKSLVASMASLVENSQSILVTATYPYGGDDYVICIKTSDTIKMLVEAVYRKFLKKKHPNKGYTESQIQSWYPQFTLFNKKLSKNWDEDSTLKSCGIQDRSDDFVLRQKPKKD